MQSASKMAPVSTIQVSEEVRDLSLESPSSIDEEIRVTENSIIDANWIIARHDNYKKEYDEVSGRNRKRMERTLGLLKDDKDKAVKERGALLNRLGQLEDEFASRGGWTRYFLATNHNGHLHSSINCPTCNKGRYPTEFSWKTAHSGRSEEEIVQLAGEGACTVCFPDAPVDRPYDLYTDAERAEMAREAEERRQAREQENAEAAEKGIWNPDGSALYLSGSGIGRGDLLRTQRAAEIRAVQNMGDILTYNQIPPKVGTPEYDEVIEAHTLANRRYAGMTEEDAREAAIKNYKTEQRIHPQTEGWQADIIQIVNAVSHKTGASKRSVLDKFREKAIAKHKRDGGLGDGVPLDWIDKLK